MKVSLGLALYTLILGSQTFAASHIIPKGYAPLLDCPATQKAPAFMVATKNETYFLAAKISNKVKMIELEIEDGDMGYSTFTPARPSELGNLAKLAAYVYIYNNEEDLEDSSLAVIVGGGIHAENWTKEQECKLIGKPRRLTF